MTYMDPSRLPQPEQRKGAFSVLRACALTYLAAALTSILQLSVAAGPAPGVTGRLWRWKRRRARGPSRRARAGARGDGGGLCGFRVVHCRTVERLGFRARRETGRTTDAEGASRRSRCRRPWPWRRARSRAWWCAWWARCPRRAQARLQGRVLHREGRRRRASRA